MRLDTSISSENQLIGIDLGGHELQVDPKKMDISTVSRDFVLWGCTINNGKILRYLFSVIRAISSYNFTKYFMFCEKLSDIIA